MVIERTPSELENFYKYIQAKGKKIVPFLGYHVYKDPGPLNSTGWYNQLGSRSGDSAFIETAQKYADNSVVFYYIEPELDSLNPGNWAAEWKSSGGFKQYLDSITTYLRNQNYMIRNNGLPKGGVIISPNEKSTKVLL